MPEQTLEWFVRMPKASIGLVAAVVLSLVPAAAHAGALQRAALAQFASPPIIAEVQVLRLDATLRKAMDTGDFVGLSVAVVHDGDVRFLRAYGETEAGSGQPVDPDTVFRIASLSKGFASSLVGLAVSEDKLSFSAPVSGFAPQLALPRGGEKSLTLADILSHRTGLPPNAYDNLLEAGILPEAILPEYRKVKPTCPVSDCYAYQNIPYDLSGRALASAYDVPFPALVEDRLFKPLGMKTASYGLGGLTRTDNWARPHTRKRQADLSLPAHPWTKIEVKLPYYETPAAGGVNASIRDMAQWLNAQLGNVPEVLAPEVLDLIHAPQVSTPTETRRMREAMPDLKSSHYAYGWRVYDYAGQTVVAHGGTVDGYGAQIMFVPDLDLGIVVLSNSRSKRLWKIAPMFLDLILGLPPKDWMDLVPDGSALSAAR
ncbi:serine hydrolase [Hyphomonas sp.]|uniref:serine hydrolase domain-containing protein n=1 Tax=Hyphomonas sp. TaxID=87 RepID=UPI0025BCA764|nr:serine hydrolase domain-containing protein [Hyphomonas sp.]